MPGPQASHKQGDFARCRAAHVRPRTGSLSGEAFMPPVYATGSTKRPGRDESLPYYLKNENARRVPTAGIVHAINY